MIESLGQPQGSDNGIPFNRTDRQSLSPPRVPLTFYTFRQWSMALSNPEAGFRGSGGGDYGEGFLYHNNIEILLNIVCSSLSLQTHCYTIATLASCLLQFALKRRRLTDFPASFRGRPRYNCSASV